MCLAKCKVLPPRKWMHDNSVRNICGQTINDILMENKMPSLEHIE